MGHETSRFMVRDVGINVRFGGTGERILFLHGASDALSWLPIFDMLAEHFELLVPDHPGFGESDDPQWINDVPDLAMFYLDFLEEMNLQGVHLIGHSLGGWLAAEIAIRDASRLRRLTLIAPAGIRVKGTPQGDIFIWSPEERVRNLFWDQSLAQRILDQQYSEQEVERALRNRFAATKFLWQPRGFDPALEKWLHRVKVPAQIIWGDSDQLLPPAYADRWLQRLPHARMSLIAQSGHLPHVEKAEEVARAVTAFAAETA
jgi:pimeloyl-ACP methyl ester carboxylesterase